MNTNGNYYVNRLRRRESFKRLINIGLSAICLFLEIALFAYMWQFHFQFRCRRSGTAASCWRTASTA